MYPEKLANGKLRLIGRYKDPYTNKVKRTSVELASETPQAINKASRLLNEKITRLQNQTSGSDITFGQLVEDWKMSHASTVKPRTMKVYKRPIEIIKSHISEDVIVRNFDTKLVQSFIDNIRSKYADNTVNLIKQPLNMMLNYAVSHKYLENNPLGQIKIKRRVKTNDNNMFIGSEQVIEIIDEIRSHHDSSHIANFLETIYLTGMRPGELLALKWENVDLEKKTANIVHTLDYSTNGHRRAELTTTKNEESKRVIALPDRVIEILISEQNYQKIQNLENDFVFISKNGTHLSINTINRRAKKASLKVFGIKFTAHKYRHAHVTLLAELGIPLKAIMDRVGHSDSKTTIKIYTHVTERMGEQLIEKINIFAPKMPQKH